MNGRIYDPLLGRFLSADLHVPSPGDLQSFNRYSYVRNNPLSRIDPTGYIDEAAEEKRKEQERIEARARQYADELQKLTGAKVSVNWNGERWHVTLTQASPAKATTGAADLARAESNDATGETPEESKLDHNSPVSGAGTSTSQVSSTQAPTAPGVQGPPPVKNEELWNGKYRGGYLYTTDGNKWVKAEVIDDSPLYDNISATMIAATAIGATSAYSDVRGLLGLKAASKILGRTFFFTGAFLASFAAYQGIRDGNWEKVGMAALDVGVSAAGTFSFVFGPAAPYVTGGAVAYFAGRTYFSYSDALKPEIE